MDDVSLESIHEDILGLKRDIAQIKRIVTEEYDLNDEAKASLDNARKTPSSKYLKHEAVMKKFLK